jgi:hypothetical protein
VRAHVDREGVVYFIQAVHGGPVKIGFTARGASGRLSEHQGGSPYRLIVIHQMQGTMRTERELHVRFKDSLVSGREWFAPTPELADLCGCRLDTGEPEYWDASPPTPTSNTPAMVNREAERRYYRLMREQKREWNERHPDEAAKMRRNATRYQR